MPETDSIISIAGVSKLFGAVSAVDEVSFDIERGEFFSLLGPSGCGKTTLLRMLAGFEQPTSGEIFIDGEPVAGVPANRRPTNMVFQSYAIFPHLDVAENIGYGLRNARLSKPETAARVAAALELVKLAGYGTRRANQLSGGQRQRVALARALVCRPKVLLLDEPLGALDKKLREEMQIELRALQKNVGITFVFVTHDQEEALALSDRIAVMSTGKVLQIDSPGRLYEKPNCREVAEFIGTMNLLAGEFVASAKGQVRFTSGALGTFQLSPSHQPPSKSGEVFLALRPENLGLAATKPPPAHNAIAGTIEAVSYRGDRSHFLVQVPGHPTPMAILQSNGGEAVAAPLQIGAKVWVHWPQSAGVLLQG